MSIAAQEADLARDMGARKAQIHAADCETCGAGPGELCTDWCGWPTLEPVTRPVGWSHQARMLRAMPGLMELARDEAAFAHLASFQRGQRVVVTSPRWTLPGIVTKPQRSGGAGDIRHAYLVAAVDEAGREAPVPWMMTVDGMLSGRLTVAAEADAADGYWQYFDAATWAAGHPEG